MTNSRPVQITATLVAAGGLAWLAKLAFLTAVDGDEALSVAICYLLGAGLMAAGAGVVLLRLLRPKHPALVALCCLLGPLVFLVSYAALDAVAKPAIGGLGPAWLEDEAGILVTGAFWLAAGVAQLRGPSAAAATASA